MSRPPATQAKRPRTRPTGDAAGVGALVLEIALSVSLLIPTLQALPERSRTLDHSADTNAGEWARAAMAAMDPGAVIVSWWSYSTPLWYVQLIEGLRPDVWIVDDRTRLDLNLGEVSDVIDAELPRRPVYLVRLDPGEIVRLESNYELERIEMPGESLLRVVGRRDTATTP
jgi:hypothetical protein